MFNHHRKKQEQVAERAKLAEENAKVKKITDILKDIVSKMGIDSELLKTLEHQLASDPQYSPVAADIASLKAQMSILAGLKSKSKFLSVFQTYTFEELKKSYTVDLYDEVAETVALLQPCMTKIASRVGLIQDTMAARLHREATPKPKAQPATTACGQAGLTYNADATA